jgi:predicted nucleic acid-binding protein
VTGSATEVVRGLLDTSVLVALEHIPAEALPREPAIAAITLAELAAGPHAAEDVSERAKRQQRLQLVEALMNTIPFDAAAARAYGSVYAATGSRDRKPRGTRALDLLIAAVALAHELPLFTRNPRDFEHLRAIGLEVHAV